MDVSSCPVYPALPWNPSSKQLHSQLTAAASTGCFHWPSFIHFFPLRRCLKPTNYHQLPPDGLHRCSRFSCPFKQPCINKPVVTNKKARWTVIIQSLSKRGRMRGSPCLTPEESKSTACYLQGCIRTRTTGIFIKLQAERFLNTHGHTGQNHFQE